jgi:hypothetical protein
MSVPASSSDAPLRSDLVRRSRRCRSIAATTAPFTCGRKGARRISRSAHRPACTMGEGRAEPPSHGGARHERPVARDQLPLNYCLDAGMSPQPCSRASLSADKPDRPFSPAIRSTRAARVRRALCGIPFCPVSPAYSLISKDYGKLGFVMKLLTPACVCRRRDEIRRGALRQCSGRNRNRRLARRRAGRS